MPESSPDPDSEPMRGSAFDLPREPVSESVPESVPEPVSDAASEAVGAPVSSNPFRGRPGFWNRVNQLVYPLAGPAQVGIGRPEAPYVPPADPRCPLCGRSMTEHEFVRGNSSVSTRVRCPV